MIPGSTETDVSMEDDINILTTAARSLSESVPINEPMIRMWELNENSTHYDRMVAAPSDEDLIKFWKGWASIMLITGVLTTLILIPLLLSAKARKNPFNVYLIFLMIPDMLVAWICGFTCLSNALAGHFTTPFMCRFQSFYMIAAIGSNSWLNFLIARRLYKMLDAARQFQRYPMPTNTQVVKEAVCVYVYSLFLATLGILPPVWWWPHRTRLTIGAACIPMDYSYASTAFFYIVFFPLLFGIPLAYVCWAAYKIYQHNMLPPSGRRRILTIYFFRLAAVFVVMWLPGLLLLFVMSAWIPPWVQWSGGAWSHLQGLVSALLSLLKPDIWKAVLEFWCCTPRLPALPDDEEDDNNNPQRPTSSIVTKKPWANSSVYWSSQIGLQSNKSRKKGANIIRSIHSRVSSYREADDDLEAVGELHATTKTRSQVLASDDSGFSLGSEEEDEDQVAALPETQPDNRPTVDEEESRGMSAASSRRRLGDETETGSRAMTAGSSRRRQGDETDAPVGTIYIVPKA